MNKQEIKNWLDKYKITNYTINDDLTVDVHEEVDLVDKELMSFPFKFGVVDGYFDCSSNNLISLKNCPNFINSCGHFDCSHNRLTSLEHCPKVINDFTCHDNKLTSLEHCPKIVLGNFSCAYNRLTSLEHCAKIVDKDFDCSRNRLTSLEHCPKVVHGGFWCDEPLKKDPRYLRWLLAKKLSEL